VAEQNLDIVVAVQGAQQAASQIEGVSKATHQVGTQSEETSKKTANLRRTMSGLATGFLVYKGAQWIKGAVNETTNLAKATVGLQRITGMDTKSASAWVAIAKERGVQSKQLNMGFIALARNISSAAGGSKTSAKAFQALGLDAGNLKVQDAKTQMDMLADSFKALPPGVDKAALAQKLFGRQAQTLLPLLNQGSQGLNKQVTEMASHTGMTSKTVKDQMALVKSQREMNAAMLGLKVATGTALVPLLTSLTQIILPIANSFSRMMQSSQGFRIAVVALSLAITTFIVIAKALALAGLEVDAAWLLIPAVLVGIGVALYMLYTKCAWFRNAVQAVMRGAVAAFNWVKQAASDVFNWVRSHWPLLVSILGGPIGAAAVQIAKHWGDIKSAAQSVWSFLRSLGQFIAGAFSGAWSVASGAIKGVSDAISTVISTVKTAASLPGKAGGLISKGFSSVFGQTGLYASQTMPAIVGEHGPEMVTLPQGAQVHPFVQSYGGGGGGGTIHTHVYLDRRQIAHAMGDYTADMQAAR
jgi:hypothetical protein